MVDFLNNSTLPVATAVPASVVVPVGVVIARPVGDLDNSNFFVYNDNLAALETGLVAYGLQEAGHLSERSNNDEYAVGIERRQIDSKPAYVAFFNTVSNLTLLAGYPQIASLFSVASIGLTLQLGKSSDLNEGVLRSVGSLPFLPFLYAQKDLFFNYQGACDSIVTQPFLMSSSIILPFNHLLLLSKECGLPPISSRRSLWLLTISLCFLGTISNGISYMNTYFKADNNC